MFAANPTFDRAGSQLISTFHRAGSQLKFRGVGDLIPHEEKWKSINLTIQHICSDGVGDLIPYEEKWKLINHSTYLFRRGGGFESLMKIRFP